MKNIIFVILAFFVSIFFAPRAYAQLNVKVDWLNPNTIPLEMLADGNDQHIKLQKNGSSFSLNGYTLSEEAYTDLSLIASFANYSISIPVRAYRHQENTMKFIVDVETPKSCGYSIVEKLEAPVSNSIAWLQKMVIAQELAGRSGVSSCSDPLKKRVAKVWFDSSFELSTISKYYRIDPAAYSNISKFKKFKNHSDRYKRDAETFYAKHLYFVMRNLFDDEKYDEAIKIGNRLLLDISRDPYIGIYHNINQTRLEDDIAWFKTKLILKAQTTAIIE